MKNPLLFFPLMLSFIFITCKTDQAREAEFVGTYEVTLDAPEAERELDEAKEEMRDEIDGAKDEIRREMKKAREDIEAEFGEDNDFGKAIGSFVEGMGHFAEGMTELGESLGALGIDLGSNFLKNLHFKAEFQSDGDVVFGRRGKIRINGNNEVKWKIKGDKMYLWNEDEDFENADEYKMKKISDTEWELIGVDVIFYLKKEEE